MTYTAKTTSTELLEAAKEGEVLPPLPPLEQEARECGEMFAEGQRLRRQRERLERHMERADKRLEDLRIALGKAYRERQLSAPSHISSRERAKREARPPASLGDRAPMKLWSTLLAFKDEYLERDPAEVMAGMDEQMRAETKDLAPLVAQWLVEAAK